MKPVYIIMPWGCTFPPTVLPSHVERKNKNGVCTEILQSTTGLCRLLVHVDINTFLSFSLHQASQLTQLINYFGTCDGFEAVRQCLRHAKDLSIAQLAALLR